MSKEKNAQIEESSNRFYHWGHYFDIVRKQFMLNGRNISKLFYTLEFLEKRIYPKYFNPMLNSPYKYKTPTYFMENFMLMDYLYNQEVPFYGLTEDQALLAIGFAELSLCEDPFHPQAKITNMLKKSKRIFDTEFSEHETVFTRIDISIVSSALLIASSDHLQNMAQPKAPDILAGLIKDILTIGHFVLNPTNTIDAKKNIEEYCYDMNKQNEINKKKKKLVDEKYIAYKFNSEFGKNGTFKWNITPNKKTLLNFNEFQNQLENIINSYSSKGST